MGKQALEELHRRGHNNRRFPVFGGFAQLVFTGRVIRLDGIGIKRAVMLQQISVVMIKPQRLAPFLRVLLDNTGKRNHQNHPPLTMTNRVIKRKRQRRQGFSSACGHVE